MQRISITFLCLVCFSAALFSQSPAYPKGYFRWPLNLKPEIVANLGELRPNHWHMGLDIRTAQKVNQLVYAAADGYIARIGVQPTGFGRFLVINHPNGLSTLYAHLNDFAPEIEKYVRSEQYRLESWAVELELPASKFPVKKGSFISYSGTTGSSQGPHVHFEIRDTKTGKCLNPLLFGFPLQDNVRPSITRLALYDRTKSIYSGAPQFFALKWTPNGYVLPKNDVVKTGADKISFGIQAFDRISGSSNEDGIYKAQLFFDDEPVINFTIDSVGYEETSYMNAHIDYTFRFNGGVYLQHLSRLPGDRGGVYHPAGADGVIRFADTAVHTVRIEVLDGYGNETVLSFKVQYDPILTKPRPFVASSLPFIPNYVSVIEKSDFEAYLPEGAVYDTVVSYYNRSNTASAGSISALHQLNDESVPVHGNLRVRIKPTESITGDLRDKVVIERTYRNRRQVRKAVWENEWATADFGDFGNFRAYTDVQPPAVNWIGSGDTAIVTGQRLTFTPTDNSGIQNFRVELNGEWLRFTNDKGRTWIYTFDERCPYGVHQLKVIVEDIAGNRTERTGWFKRSAYTPPKKKTIKKKSAKSSTKKSTSKKSAVRKKKK